MININIYDWYDLWGGREKEMRKINCPICNMELCEDDDVFLSGRDIIGCAFCVDELTVYDHLEREAEYVAH